jgi:hypothetical protein
MALTAADAPGPSKSLAMLRYKLDELGVKGMRQEEACENFLFYWMPASGVTAEMIWQVMEVPFDYVRWMYHFQIFLMPEDWAKLHNTMSNM